MQILSRTCLAEASRLFLFYLTAYSLLATLAASIPLLHNGAPLSAVIGFIPFQILYTSPLLIPLALCTSVLSLFGRMREDGEMIALRAVGISAWSVVKGLLPLIIVMALSLSVIQHAILPQVGLKIRQGKSDLVRKGISTRINRGEPIWHNESKGQRLLSEQTDGVQLYDVVAHKNLTDRDVFVFSPLGIWRYQDNLQIECKNLRLIDIRHEKDGSINEIITATIPLSSQIIPTGGISGRQQEKPDVKDYDELIRDTQSLRQELRDARTAGYDINDRTHRHVQSSLRAHQLEWHTRMAAPYSILAYYLIAAGLALSIPIRNRIFALCIGISLIMANFLPGLIATNGLGQYLRFNPGVLVWVPNTLTALAGSLLIWRNR